MAEMNFSEEQMREFCKEAVPVVEKLLEIARKHGVEGGVRTWCADDYVSIEGTGLGGWELHKCSGEYDMTYNKRVPFSHIFLMQYPCTVPSHCAMCCSIASFSLTLLLSAIFRHLLFDSFCCFLCSVSPTATLSAKVPT